MTKEQQLQAPEAEKVYWRRRLREEQEAEEALLREKTREAAKEA
jgi:hypothetical protein